MADEINRRVASKLREVSHLLESQGANPFRAAAYAKAADTVAGLKEDISAIYEKGGIAGLDALPNIGPSIAAGIAELLRTGRWAQLERLRGASAPEKLFQTIPGVGPRLARRIFDTLHVDTLESLEIAAHDGRLVSVPGVGARRAAMIRSALSEMLRRLRPRFVPRGGERREPDIAVLLDVDREYREKAAAGKLPKIAPRRFNPEGTAWLPVLHTRRGRWDFTALFSNTARAHELGLVFDWVVLYFASDKEAEGQRTVVTETRGPLAGKRIVRGREAECQLYYKKMERKGAKAGAGPAPVRRRDAARRATGGPG